MLKRNSKFIRIALIVISFIVFFIVVRHIVEVESTPKTISKTNVPIQFNVIGITGSGVPVLLDHEIGLQSQLKYYTSEEKFEKEYGVKILWQKDCRDNRKYSFYIDPEKKESIEQTLTAGLNDITRSVTVELLEDHPSEKKQMIRINFWNDDFTYYSVYLVDKRSVSDFKYGDSTKRDGVVAAVAALKYVIPFYLLVYVLFAMAVRFESKKQGNA